MPEGELSALVTLREFSQRKFVLNVTAGFTGTHRPLPPFQ